MTDQKDAIGAANPDPGGLFDTLIAGNSEQADLTTLEGVEGVVRSYGSRIIEFRRGYLETGKTGEPASAFIKREAAELAKAFLGEDADYNTAPWNSPEQLGVALGARVGLSGEPTEVVVAYLVKFAGDLLDIAVDEENGTGGDNGFRVDVLVEETTYALLGLPLSAD
jgi:hypothetical protein